MMFFWLKALCGLAGRSHHNSIHTNTQFTMESDRDGNTALLHRDVYKRPDSSLEHEVYKKLTHTNLYLTATSHHYLVNKQAVLSALIHRTKTICDLDSLPQELKFLHQTFQDNIYSELQILQALNQLTRALPQR
jgi:hypothetical protein